MALAFGYPDVARFRRQALARTFSTSNIKKKGMEVLNSGITTAEVSFSAFAFGVAQGKYGGLVLKGVPLDALTGVVLHLAAFFPQVAQAAPHLHAIADGALASFMGSLGRQVGRGWQTPEDRDRIVKLGGGILPDGAAVMGLSGGASLADEELARMVAAGKSR